MKLGFGHLLSIALGLTGAVGLISSAAFSQSLRQQYAEDVCDWKTAEFEEMNSDIRYCIIGGKVHASVPTPWGVIAQRFEGYINKSMHDSYMEVGDYRYRSWEYALEGGKLVKYKCYIENGVCSSRPTRDVIAIKRSFAIPTPATDWKKTKILIGGKQMYVKARTKTRRGNIVTVDFKLVSNDGTHKVYKGDLINCRNSTIRRVSRGSSNWVKILPERMEYKQIACTSVR